MIENYWLLLLLAAAIIPLLLPWFPLRQAPGLY
jgi:hypothetical protein